MNDYVEGMRHKPGCIDPPGHGGDCTVLDPTVAIRPCTPHSLVGCVLCKSYERLGLPDPEEFAEALLRELFSGDRLQLSQPELVEGIADLLEDALHSPLCYIDPDETHCMCLIGRVKALLPLCEATTDNGHGIKWRCVRTIHPSTPELHNFGRV